MSEEGLSIWKRRGPTAWNKGVAVGIERSELRNRRGSSFGTSGQKSEEGGDAGV